MKDTGAHADEGNLDGRKVGRLYKSNIMSSTPNGKLLHGPARGDPLRTLPTDDRDPWLQRRQPLMCSASLL